MFFDQSPKTFCIKSKIFVIVQNEFGPIEGQGIKLKFFTPLQLQFDVKKQSLSFYNPPPQRICIRFKSGLFTNYVSIHKKAPEFHEFAISRIYDFFLTSNQNRLFNKMEIL